MAASSALDPWTRCVQLVLAHGECLLRKFVLLFGAQIIFGGTLVINNLVLARILGPTGRGMVSLLVVVPMVTVMLTNLGFQFSAPYFVSRGEVPLNVVFGTVFALTAMISAFYFLLAFMLRGPVIKDLYQNLSSQAVVLSIASLPAIFVLFYLEPVWVAINAMRVTVAVRVIQSTIYFGSVLLLVAHLRLGVTGGIAAFTIGTWSAALFAIVAAVMLAPHPRVDHLVLKRGLAFGLKPYVGYLSDHVIYRADTFVLTYLSGFQQLGYYAFAQPLAELIWFLSNSVRPILFTRVASESDRSTSVTPAVVRLILSLAVLMGVTIYVATFVIVRFYLAAFRPALLPLAILLLSTVIAIIFQLLLSDVTARGHGGGASVVSLAVLPVALLAYLALIPRFGALGAACGSLISYSLMSLLTLSWVKRLRGVSPLDVLVPRRADYAILAATFRRMMDEARSA
jgi:O-antigen/teichoic acid export membrane protein